VNRDLLQDFHGPGGVAFDQVPVGHAEAHRLEPVRGVIHARQQLVWGHEALVEKEIVVVEEVRLDGHVGRNGVQKLCRLVMTSGSA